MPSWVIRCGAGLRHTERWTDGCGSLQRCSSQEVMWRELEKGVGAHQAARGADRDVRQMVPGRRVESEGKQAELGVTGG